MKLEYDIEVFNLTEKFNGTQNKQAAPFNGTSKEAQGQGQPTKAKKESKTPATKVGDKRTLSDTKSPAKATKEPVVKSKQVDDSSSITSLSEDGNEAQPANKASDESSDL